MSREMVVFIFAFDGGRFCLGFVSGVFWLFGLGLGLESFPGSALDMPRACLVGESGLFSFLFPAWTRRVWRKILRIRVFRGSLADLGAVDY